MQIFEFHFNPRKEDKVFDSFVFEPENLYEKRVGNLYIAGEITNILSQNYRLLNNLASIIKKGYYRLSSQISPLGALKRGLEDANKFLEREEKEENISWLGNLNIAVISIKELNLNFTKTGTIKILLVRRKEIIDIGKEIEDKNIESPSPKTFSNIVSGKLLPDDKLLILTKEIFDIFLKEGVLSEISSCLEKHKEKKLDKGLRYIFNKYKKSLGDTAGLFLLILVGIAIKKPKEIKETPSPQKKPVLVFSSLTEFSKKSLSAFKKVVIQRIITRKISEIKTIIKNKSKIPIFSKIRYVFINLLDLQRERKKRTLSKRKVVSISNIFVKKAIVLTFILIAVVGTGFYISQIQKQKNIQRIQEVLKESQEITERANIALQKNNQRQANLLFQEAWRKISLLAEEKDVPLKNDINIFKKSLEKKLFLLNKVETIEPQLLFELQESDFFPQKIFVFKKDIYFFEPNSKRIYQLDIEKKKGKFISLETEAKFALDFESSLVFISETNKAFSLKDPSWIKILEFPYRPVNISCISSFTKNIYLFDSLRKELIKFEFQHSPSLSGYLWFNHTTKKPLTAQSMAIDGSIWILDKNNCIWQFFKGELKNKFSLDIFPFVQKITRISTKHFLSYLYLLEPDKKRIIVLNKEGDLIKQLFSERFDDLKDIFIENNETIYILNGKILYKIQI